MAGDTHGVNTASVGSSAQVHGNINSLDIELHRLQSGRQDNEAKAPQVTVRTEWSIPTTPADIESRPGTPPARNETLMVQSLTNPPMNKWRFGNAALIALSQGMNDSAPGALLPYIEAYYSIDYTTVSLLFVATAVGFIVAAPFTSALHAKLARGKMIAFSQCLGVIGYSIISARAPFPAVVLSFFLYGLATAWSLALNNTFCASLTNATTLLGLFHGCYGIGGIIGPLIATTMIGSGAVWFDFYPILLGLTFINTITAYFVNRNYEEECEAPLITSTPAPSAPTKTSLLKAILKPTTILGALFIFAYQGAEVSLSGWILSFLLTTHPHPASQSLSLGYVTSGFWAGVTLGRFLLSHLAHRIGEKIAVMLLTVMAVGLQTIVWLVPNIIGASVAVALVGLVLGPIYACAVSIFSRLLRKNEFTSAIAFISALGSSGGAVAPFLTGAISQKVGTWVVNPMAIGLFGAMMVAWMTLPRMPKRME